MKPSIFNMQFVLPPVVVISALEDETPIYIGEQTLDLTLLQNFFIYLGSWWRLTEDGKYRNHYPQYDHMRED